MPTRRKYTPEIILTDEEREELERLSRRRKTAQALALRSRIVLHCAKGMTHLEMAKELNPSNVVCKSV